ncbi:MAG: bifunctional folylpolyglutamate synthase/dihydrofolate synthase [Elusimicrobia bacterium]|nr:bifunctional folylpolyglutamate synthase/dihydrofolate synthase [Elusimicrobiota bacterium]
MSCAEALSFLDGRQETRWKLGLSRIAGLLAAVANPHDGLPAIHVAGTNGKGSFCAMLASALTGGGLKTGLYTSPHLVTPLERISIDGRNISEADFARHILKLKAAEPEESTYFELVTAAAFMHFKQEGVEAAVIETGLGGRLDATNALKDPLMTVVTSIDYDHMQHLGDTLEKIAEEKAGIIKGGAPFLCGEVEPLSKAVLTSKAKQVGAKYRSAPPALERISEDWENGTQRAKTQGGTEVVVPLLGDAALKNAAMVLTALELLKLPIHQRGALAGLAKTRWPARFEVRKERTKRIVLDGAHNPAAMEAFAKTWKRSPYFSQDPLIVMGVLADKEWERLAVQAASLSDRFIATQPGSPRALPADKLAQALRAAGAKEVGVICEAGAAIEHLRQDPSIAGAVIGSFYLAGLVGQETVRV